jgi:hypothetical protein
MGRLHGSEQDGGCAPFFLAFCVSCFARGYQLVESLPVNLLRLWPHRGTTAIFLALFVDPAGEWKQTLAWIQYHCQEAIEAKLLIFRVYEEEFFHASVMKNTAHVMAGRVLEAAGYTFSTFANCQVIFCNLDADNVIGSNFVQIVDDHFITVSDPPGGSAPGGYATREVKMLGTDGSASDRPPPSFDRHGCTFPSRMLHGPFLMQWSSSCKGITGRILYDAATFLNMHGYNEDCMFVCLCFVSFCRVYFVSAVLQC